eukprot:gene21038-biopygen5634
MGLGPHPVERARSGGWVNDTLPGRGLFYYLFGGRFWPLCPFGTPRYGPALQVRRLLAVGTPPYIALWPT